MYSDFGLFSQYFTYMYRRRSCNRGKVTVHLHLQGWKQTFFLQSKNAAEVSESALAGKSRVGNLVHVKNVECLKKQQLEFKFPYYKYISSHFSKTYAKHTNMQIMQQNHAILWQNTSSKMGISYLTKLTNNQGSSGPKFIQLIISVRTTVNHCVHTQSCHIVAEHAIAL